MIVACDKCGKVYDDEPNWTICPHGPHAFPLDAYCPKCDTVIPLHGKCPHQQTPCPNSNPPVNGREIGPG